MKKKKKLTMKYILQEIEIANIILDEIDKSQGGNPEFFLFFYSSTHLST